VISLGEKTLLRIYRVTSNNHIKSLRSKVLGNEMFTQTSIYRPVDFDNVVTVFVDLLVGNRNIILGASANLQKEINFIISVSVCTSARNNSVPYSGVSCNSILGFLIKSGVKNTAKVL
jgi:hypothetical protein